MGRNIVAGTIVVTLILLCTTTNLQPNALREGVNTLATPLVSSLRIFSSASTNEALWTPPTTSFAPFVEMTDRNARLFLRDKQHAEWQNEVDKDWKPAAKWRFVTNTTAQTLGELEEQKTCLTYEVNAFVYTLLSRKLKLLPSCFLGSLQ